MTQQQSSLRLNHREHLVQGFSRLIRELINDGRDAFYLNFMFNQLPGSQHTQMEIMKQEVERVHCILTRHIVRRPNAEQWAHLRPVFIGCHDRPVFKWDRGELGQLDVVNDGFHFNLVALVPPPIHPMLPVEFQYWLRGPLSRLKVPLDQHFKEKRRFYINERLARIHVTRINRGTMADYTLKTFKHGRADADSFLILN